MRIQTLTHLALLGLLLWATCVQTDDTDTDEQTEGETPTETPDDSEEEPKKEKTTEIEEEKDVMVLHINNFDRALGETKFLLVEFCEWCQLL